MEINEHLFRHEAGRMVVTLTRIFGPHNLALAEDVVQDAFCRAFEVWKVRGVPENPSAWLMATAKNRAIDALRREKTARTFEPELAYQIQSGWTLVMGDNPNSPIGVRMLDAGHSRPYGGRTLCHRRYQGRFTADDVLLLPSSVSGRIADCVDAPYPLRIQHR